MTAPRFDVTVRLSGQDGNAFSIMAAVIRAIRGKGATPEQIEEYQRDSMSGDYDHLIQTAMKWVTVK